MRWNAYPSSSTTRRWARQWQSTVAVHPAVDQRLRYAVRRDHREEQLLELRPGEQRDGEDPREGARAAAAVRSAGQLAKLLACDESADVGLGERSLERLRAEHVGQVDQRPKGAGEGDAVSHRSVFRPEPARLVDDHSGVAMPCRGKDVDGPAPGADDRQPCARRLVAQPRLQPARENGGHVASEVADRGVADGVHATVQGEEPPCTCPVSDRISSEAEGQQLRTRHHPVLARRDTGDRVLDFGT